MFAMAFASDRWQLSSRVTDIVIVLSVAAAIVTSTTLAMKAAARNRRAFVAFGGLIDPAGEKQLRRNVLGFKIGILIVSVGLIRELWEDGSTPLGARSVLVLVALLLISALVAAIRATQRKLTTAQKLEDSFE
jgi:hypothetical protein